MIEEYLFPASGTRLVLLYVRMHPMNIYMYRLTRCGFCERGKESKAFGAIDEWWGHFDNEGDEVRSVERNGQTRMLPSVSRA